MSLSLRVDSDSGIAVVEVIGNVVEGNAPQLRSLLLDVLADSVDHVVVDLTGVTLLDSTGLGVLVAGWKRSRAVGGELALIVTSSRILQLLRVTRLDQVFTVRSSRNEVAVQGAPPWRGSLDSLIPDGGAGGRGRQPAGSRPACAAAR